MASGFTLWCLICLVSLVYIFFGAGRQADRQAGWLAGRRAHTHTHTPVSGGLDEGIRYLHVAGQISGLASLV